MTGKEAALILDPDTSREYIIDNGLTIRDVDKACRIATEALAMVDALKKQIKDRKKSVKSGNSDYLTGYLCALSAVEGMIAESEDKK